MSLISFTCAAPSASWSPSVNPRHGGGYARSKERFQPKDFSDGGDLYSYSHGEKNGRTLQWGMLPSANMDSLLTFIAAMHGGRYSFHFSDYEATVYTACRILNYESFPFTNKTLLFYEVTLELEVA